MARRLLIAFVVLLLASVFFWYVGPKFGFRFPWFVPLLGFAIIAFGVIVPAIAEMPRRAAKTPEEEINTPDPGPSPEDVRRFGDPWLTLTDRDD